MSLLIFPLQRWGRSMMSLRLLDCDYYCSGIQTSNRVVFESWPRFIDKGCAVDADPKIIAKVLIWCRNVWVCKAIAYSYLNPVGSVIFLVSLTVRAAYFEWYFATSFQTYLSTLAVVWLVSLAVFQADIAHAPRRDCVRNNRIFEGLSVASRWQ